MSKQSDKNTLYDGDNLDVLDRYVPDESVDLVYLDPPFNSDADYNILFKLGRSHDNLEADSWAQPNLVECFPGRSSRVSRISPETTMESRR